MKRSILMSLLVIGAVGAFMFGAGTFAPFTAEDSDDGTIKAASVSITVSGTSTLDFTGGSAGCDTDVLPGDTCGPDTVTVTNTGDVDLTLSAPVVTEGGDLEGCGDGDSLSTSVGAYSGDGVLNPAESETFTISVTLEASADNTCIGDVGTVDVSVTGTSS